MGTQGVPLNIPKSVIIAALTDNKGRISYACKALSIHSKSLLRLIREDPDLVELLANLRHDYETSMLDRAEDVLGAALDQHEKDMTNALKATIYTLNNKGRERGYVPPTYREPQEGIQSPNEIFSQAEGIDADSRREDAEESRMAAQQPVLDKEPRREARPVQAKLGAEDSDFRLPPV